MDDLFPIPESHPDPLTVARAELAKAEAEYADAFRLFEICGPDVQDEYGAARNKLARCRTAVHREALLRLNP